MLTMSRLSREYVFLDVTTPNDLSTATAEVAFISTPEGIPVPADWNTAVLVANRIRILVGPDHIDAVTLTAGDYQVWAKITDAPEMPVRRVGVLTIE